MNYSLILCVFVHTDGPLGEWDAVAHVSSVAKV